MMDNRMVGYIIRRSENEEGESKGGTPHLAHDFARQSVVCYTLYLWDCEKSGIGIRVVDFEADKKRFVSVLVSVTEVKLFD